MESENYLIIDIQIPKIIRSDSSWNPVKQGYTKNYLI